MKAPETSFLTEEIPALEYDVHCLWATARGLNHLISRAHPSEIDAVRDEAIETANMILAAFGEVH